MAEFEDLEERIADALARADDALGRLGSMSRSGEASLRAELEAERQAAAQLEERLRALDAERGEADARSSADAAELRKRVDDLEGELARAIDEAKASQASANEAAGLRGRVAELERELEDSRAASAEVSALRDECERLREALASQSAVAERLRKANADVTAAMKVLREAQVAGLMDAHLVDKAMKKEIDALHAARDGDIAELDAILAALAPLIEEKEKQDA